MTAANNALGRTESRRVLGRAFQDLRQQGRLLVWAGLVIVVNTMSHVAGPVLVRYGIDQGLRQSNRGALRLSVAGYAAVAIVAFVSSRLQITAISRLGERYLRELRVRVFGHLLRLSMSFYDRERTGVLVARMTSDIDSMGELVQYGLLQFIASAMLLVISIVLLAALSPLLLVLCLVPVPFVIAASVVFQRQSTRAYLTVRERVGVNLSRLQEGIRGVRLIQAFHRTDDQIDTFVQSNRALYDAHLDSVRISAWYFPVIEFAGAATTAMVVGVGGVLVHKGTVSLGTVAAFILLIANLFEPISQLSQLFNSLQAAAASLHKLYGLIDTPVDVVENLDAVELVAGGPIVLCDVGFSYGDQRSVLSGVSMTINRGERVAFVGPTGAGKSTLAKLIARMYDPTIGSISIAGTDLRMVSRSSLRQRLAVVPQEGFLFQGSVRDNVRISRPEASDAEVDTILQRLGLADRFSPQPDDLDTSAGKLSAGERQLVSLARAALADPDLLILDEATSNLDPGTEALVERALETLLIGRTVIVIAHRLTTASRCDRIAVIENGRLAEWGSHAELLAMNGQYSALFSAWLGAHKP